MERARANYYQEDRYWVAEKPDTKISVQTLSKKWHFKPRSIWPFVMWGLALFIGFKITVLPLIEGVYNYVASVNEISQLKTQYTTMQKQLIAMKKKRDYMKTPSYVEERAHEIGLVKPEESQMVVMDGVPDGTTIVKKHVKKNVEIGN
jgi:Septum formation initiator